jgi:prepilin-type N-terminal cleavage/methylation domain-containing protein
MRRTQRGFTLVELLVVIAIIGILVALLLPAVQAARESARRTQCSSNLKQLALALQDYHDVWHLFPPGSKWVNIGDTSTSDTPNLSENWVIMILPFIEEQNLHDKFNLSKYISDPVNAQARGTLLSFMLCPTDAFNQVPYDGSQFGLGSNWARGNYGANGMLDLESNVSSWTNPLCRGVMGPNLSLNMKKIGDGTSKTILLGELRSGVVSIDCRGTWAMSGGCPSGLYAHGYSGDDNGPNATSPKADDTANCELIESAVSGSAASASNSLGESILINMNMPCSDDNGTASWPNWQQTARSLHPGGVLVAFADGSVQFIFEAVQLGSDQAHLGVWDMLNLSNDGQVLQNGTY